MCTCTYRLYRKCCHTCHVVTGIGGYDDRKRDREKIVKAAKDIWYCTKFISPVFDGMPDRLVLLPKGNSFL